MKRFSFGLLVMATVVALVGMGGGQVTGKHLSFSADRYWDNNGVLKTDGTIEAQDGLIKTVVDFSSITPAGTAGSLITTGSTWVTFPTAGACGMKLLLSNTSATGEFASLRIRARSNSDTPTVAGNFAASAGQNDYGNLYAVQGYAQPLAYTQADADNIVSALYGCSQRTAASVGRDWVGWLDTHMTVKATGGSYLLRLSHNGSVANDGAITVYSGGRMPVLFNFEDAAGFLTDADASKTTAAGAIAVQTPAGTKYIVLYE